MVISIHTCQNQGPPTNILGEGSNILPICLLESRREFGGDTLPSAPSDAMARFPTPMQIV